MADALLTYEPVILMEIQLDGGTEYVATRDYYYSGNKYRGGLLNVVVNQELTNLFYGVIKPTGFKARLANIDDNVNSTWDEIAATEEFRGRWCKATRYDPTDGADVIGYGKISEVNFADEVEIYIGGDTVLQTKLPQDVITTDGFSDTALDLGKPVNICFGKCYDVPLWNIQNDTTNDYYDYLIGYGPIEGLDETFASNLGVKRDGVMVPSTEYTLYDGSQGSPFSGYAFIRFTVEQVDNNHYCSFTADVKGLTFGSSPAAMNRNFIDCIEQILTDSTWGLNDSVDSTTFTSAASTISNGNDFYCDGAITDQRTAESVLNDLLFPSRAYLERGSDGEWEIYVDTTGSSSMTLGENDGQYNNCHLRGGLRTIPADQIVSEVTVQYDFRK